MADIDINARLRERFAAPVEHWERRRVVVWHDAEGQFADEYAAIAADPSLVACGARALCALDARDYGSFELKRAVLREDVDQDLLLYADRPLDLSGDALAQNWLADVELYADHFQADWLSLLVGEIGAEGAAREGFSRFRPYFLANGRRQRFLRLVPHAQSPADVALGVVAATLGAKDTTLPAIVFSLLDALDGGGLSKDLGRYGADAALAALLKSRLGYDGPLDDRAGIASAIAVSALWCTLPEGALAKLSGVILAGNEEASLSLWREWQESRDASDMKGLARLVERRRAVPGMLGSIGAADLAASDVLPCMNEAAVCELMEGLAHGSDRAAEAVELSAQTKGMVSVGSMQAAFPSMTEFGMASLLPHDGLEFRPSQSKNPFVDGIETGGTKNRERVLRAREPKARAVQWKDLRKLNRARRKELVGDARVLYVYHDLIDSTGEEYPTEDRVLGACEQAVADVVAIVKVLMNDLRYNRIVVTADHGFLYTRRPLEEAQKVSLCEVGADVAFAGRRHAVTTAPPKWPFLTLRLEYDGHERLWGAAPRECVRIRRGGAGKLYVHGGVSLQELCVPVVSVHFHDAGKSRVEREPARLSLLSTTRRVTSAIFAVELWQREAVGGKVVAAEYDLVMEDANGAVVTDVRRATAASENPDDQARVTKVQLALKPGREYSSRAAYWLVCRDASGREAWREQFRVEIAIALVDDFGF